MSADTLIGRSAEIARVRNLIPKLARSRAPVLILGESGTGKEVAARAIHNANPVGGFVPIDCGALVGSLMESELFGHARGAFTGALDSKPGLIELADGGTAFFDEIGDLRLDMQVKLLRLIQEHEFRPVGSLKTKKIQVRILAATHKNLTEAVKRKTFREDLYYRLNVLKVRLPALRERREDIPLLMEHFLKEFGPRRVPEEVERALNSYDWPGNVRELRNCIERMAAISSGPALRLEDLPTSVELARAAGESPARGVATSLPESEKRTILNALGFTGGHRDKAAKLLGIGRTTLYRKMKQYGIADDDRARRYV